MDELILEQEVNISAVERALVNFRKRSEDQITLELVEGRRQYLLTAWNACQRVDLKIIKAAHGSDKSLIPYFFNDIFVQAEDVYLNTLDTFNELIGKLKKEQLILYRNSTSSNSSLDSSKIAKLPRIELPKFSGDYLEWQNFKDLFQSIVASDPNLPDVQKMHYLKSSLLSEPAQLIKHLGTTPENYQSAWSILTKRYENSRAIINSYLNNFMSLPAIMNETVKDLKNLRDKTSEAVQALKSLGRNIDSDLLVFVVSRKMGKFSLIEWEKVLGDKNEYPSYEELDCFLATRIRTLEALQNAKDNLKSTKSTQNQASTASTFSMNAINVKCILCNDSNQKFNQASKNEADKKLEIPKKVEKVSQDQRVLNQKESNSTPKNDTVSLNHIRGKTVLLATAKICVVGKNGERIEIRALLDQGSEVTFITERVVQMLRVKKEPAMIRVTGIDNAFLGTAKSLVNVIITPTQNFEKKIPISALVLPKLNNHIVSKADYLSDWEHLRDLDLADPTPFDNKEFDMIIGADYYGSLLLPGLIKGPVRSPTAQATVFGWIISGPLNSLNNVSPTSKVVHHCVGLSDIHNDLQKFWEIEEFPQKSNLTDDETKCEEHFVNTHSRNEEGNYVVRYPFKNDPPERLGDSLQNAKRLLLQTERRVQNNPELKQDYYDFLNEYKDLKHVIEIDYNDEQNSNFEIENYLPYHIVIRVSSSSTPLRIVFNASFPTLTGVSLNDLLLPGPKLHADIPSIIIRWRNYRFVMTADISKMFRRIQIDKRDVNFQRIICRLNETEEIKHFQLLTLTYGVSSSPFLANRVIKQLANDEGDNFPKAKQILLNDIYVDDGLFGADDLETALQIKNEFIQLLAKGGFPVHKISSNSPLLSDSKLSKYSERLILNDTNSKAVLGLYWDPEYDVFRISMSPVVNVNFTKRNVLSVIAKQFDPLGWISPILIIAKIIIQDLWIRHLDWDETLPDDLSVRWKSYCHELNNVQKITIPRWTGLTSHDVIEIHGFADASSRAYAAVVYLRIQNVSKKINVSLLLGKTKVAPLKTLTIPRLELCAAVLLAKLLKKIVNDLQLDDVPVYGWSDSTIVLAWLSKHPSTWRTFIANRVETIQSLIPTASWKHVPTADNPADCATRGIYPLKLLNHELWWSGPKWLSDSPTTWPTLPDLNYNCDVKTTATKIHMATTDQSYDFVNKLSNRYSSWPKLLRITALVFKFINKCKTKLQSTNSETLKSDPKVSKDMSAFNINWDFIPPYSPHFGGIWEAGIKSTKKHLNRIMGPHTLTFEELTTLLCQIESCLNSRPIAAFSNEVDDYSYLSPGHFLIGKPLLAMPEKSLPSSQHSLLTRWQLVQQKTEQFWKQWSLEYQQDLQKRYKWTKSNPNIKIGDLVLIRDINLPKSNWQMGRVLKIHPGKDG
ncbi:uncharacterized protein LOC122506733, partial [Leptopilina heterotoma]|uniref:uncharacterized protein LOC122506733 n=1 Tax=Leptopilina heterotoma TaxID=63436 RepID=UPI001CAA3279